MKTLVFLILVFSASRITPSPGGQGVVIWNVGQGQWVSVIKDSTCYHFDMGGEFFPWPSIKAACQYRKNKVFLSHWDWDHIGALAQNKISRLLPELCIQAPPIGPTKKKRQALLARWPRCSDPQLVDSMRQWLPSRSLNSNDSSQVFQYHQLLIPGDSSKAQEKTWALMPWVPSSKFLVLGHHGSSTSTSDELLNRLPQLQMAFSSARWRRYSHPHPQVVARLKVKNIPLLRTEDWGNIWIQ